METSVHRAFSGRCRESRERLSTAAPPPCPAARPAARRCSPS